MIFLLVFACQSTSSPYEGMIHVQEGDLDFYIDQYEYPNRKGERPMAQMSFEDAKEYCQQSSKRLCTREEWQQACKQSQDFTFVYGNQYKESWCNSNQSMEQGHTSLLHSRQDHAVSGEYLRCKTESGIFDMNGNLEEWVADDWNGTPGSLMGGAWYSHWRYADCSGEYSHQPDYRISMNRPTDSAGVRCCLSKSPPSTEDISRYSEQLLQQTDSGLDYNPDDEIQITENIWMDRYEYPNQKGALPVTAISWDTARQYCLEHGKDLCSATVWEQACFGPNRSPYPYGFSYQEGLCSDSSGKASPSGTHPSCRSFKGAMDMTGSVWEWTLSDLTVKELQRIPDQPLKEIRGGSWFSDSLKARCQPIVGYPIVSASARFPDLGFRCCRGQSNRENTQQTQLSATVSCPENMVAIGSFCIDTYEYPNQKGRLPLATLNQQEAQERCASEGKSLCSTKQWLLACQGKKKRRWSYGNEYQTERCHHNSSLEQGGPIPSGSKQECQTPEGVFDLTGNLWEWTTDGSVRGGNWNFSEGLGQCRASAQPQSEHRSEEIGFRCCLKPSK